MITGEAKKYGELGGTSDIIIIANRICAGYWRGISDRADEAALT